MIYKYELGSQSASSTLDVEEIISSNSTTLVVFKFVKHSFHKIRFLFR